mgnify:CR=1 FL=1
MKKVICPGEALIDFVSMDLGKSLKETSGFLKKAGGAPANVAAAISKLGAEAYFCGTVGNDAFGSFLEDTFKNNKINTELMFKLDTNNTTFAFVSLMEDGERDSAVILSAMNELIRQEPMAELDYIAIVDTQTLEPLKQISGDALVALAARFGKTRLIDNLLWEGK